MKEVKKVYLASPYSHEDPTVMHARYEAAVAAAADLMAQGYIVFAPIAHSHAIGLRMGTETSHEFWLKQDMPWLRASDTLYVLMLPGWMESRGVAEEIAEADRHGMDIKFIAPTYWDDPRVAGQEPPEAEPGDSKPTNPKDALGVKKAPMSTVPAGVMLEVGVAMLEGAAKYGRHNYRAVGVRSSVYYDATMRHLMSWWEGENTDPDSGLSHITKAIASLAVLRDSMMQGKLHDDRPPRSVPFVMGLNSKAEEIVEDYSDRSPHHYTEESLNW